MKLKRYRKVLNSAFGKLKRALFKIDQRKYKSFKTL